jgi:membrane protein DedA with SNARE-associated domain
MEVIKKHSGKFLFIIVALFAVTIGYELYHAPVEGFEEKFVYLLRQYGYIILFAWSILEGEMGLIMAGIMSHTGDMNLYIAIFVAGLGGFAGDQIYFYTGRFNRGYIIREMASQRRKFALAHLLLKKYGWPLIFAQRYMYGMRTVIPMAIGLTRYSSKTFALINLLSAWAWATITIVPAYIFGEELLELMNWAKSHWYVILPIAFVVAGLVYYYFHTATKKQEKSNKEEI